MSGSSSGRGKIAALAVVVVVVAAVVATVSVRHGHHSSTSSPTPTLPAAAYIYAHAAGATTLAGMGAPGYSGDGHAAVGAQLDAPAGIAEDAEGDLFIADTGNCRVREVPARTGTSFAQHVQAGSVVTVAGGACSAANPAPSALALDATGDLFIVSGPAARVEELPTKSGTAFGVTMKKGKVAVVAGTGVTGFGGDGGPAVSSELADPTGVAVDPQGDLLIADTANCRVRLVAATSGTRYGVAVVAGHIFTVAGTGVCGAKGDGGNARNAQLWDPGALAVDRAGDVVVADQGNRTIRVLAAHAGRFYGAAIAADHLGTVAGEGSYGPYLADGVPANFQTAEINFPSGVAVDREGNLYISDGLIHAIRFVPATTTTLLGKKVVANDMYTAAGALSTGALHNETTWIQTRVLDPTDLAMSSDGRLVYSDTEANVVRELPADR